MQLAFGLSKGSKALHKRLNALKKWPKAFKRGPETPKYPSAGARLYGAMSHNIWFRIALHKQKHTIEL